MRLLIAALAAVGIALAAAPAAAADPVYVERAEWVQWGDLKSLRVYPSVLARAAASVPGGMAQAEQAWGEVLTVSPAAAIPGMREQFLCHWFFAELVEPGKASWNLEPWRPEVTDTEMMAAGCNPGGAEEPF